MNAEGRPAFRRVLLKLGGEALSRPGGSGFDWAAAAAAADRLGAIRRRGVELAVVVGAGNLWRGAAAAGHLPVPVADAMGMLATMMNGLCLEGVCRERGVPAVLFSAFPVGAFARPYERMAALAALTRGEVVLLGGGTGHPFFTTDTTAALRAAELEADLLVKATKVGGVYTDDPARHPEAVPVKELTYDDVLQRRLGVLDATAVALARDRGLTTVVVNFWEPGALEGVLAGDRGRGSWLRGGGNSP